MQNSYVSQVFTLEYHSIRRLTGFQSWAPRLVSSTFIPSPGPLQRSYHTFGCRHPRLHIPNPFISCTLPSSEKKKKTRQTNKTTCCLLTRSLTEYFFGRMAWGTHSHTPQRDSRTSVPRAKSQRADVSYERVSFLKYKLFASEVGGKARGRFCKVQSPEQKYPDL